MIVTPRDVVIADYAIRSYAKIRDLDFSLLVYSNYLLPEQKAYFFPRWEVLPFVEIARNPHHDDDLRGIGSRIQSDSAIPNHVYKSTLLKRQLSKILPTFF